MGFCMSTASLPFGRRWHKSKKQVKRPHGNFTAVRALFRLRETGIAGIMKSGPHRTIHTKNPAWRPVSEFSAASPETARQFVRIAWVFRFICRKVFRRNPLCRMVRDSPEAYSGTKRAGKFAWKLSGCQTKRNIQTGGRIVWRSFGKCWGGLTTRRLFP